MEGEKETVLASEPDKIHIHAKNVFLAGWKYV